MPTPLRIDLHVHCAVLGDDPAFRQYGRISTWMRAQPVYRIMLWYARIPEDQASDRVLRDVVLKTVRTASLDRVVCLALDPVYDRDGKRRENLSNLWVDNSYIVKELIPASEGRILLGASVHPYDPAFETRVAQSVADGAVLLKWLPSAQQINLADPRVRRALEILAGAGRGGRPLPLLLHCGSEYAIKTTDPGTTSFDFLSWGFWDRLGNALRRKKERWGTPDVAGVLGNLRAGVEAGSVIILAHCGLPYFAPRFLSFLEHDDFPVVRSLLQESAGPRGPGKFLADVSALMTPFRRSYWGDIRKLPEHLLLAGSDFPVPVFELSASPAENRRDF
ncbi:MAG: hypothetical protein ACT4PM_12490, partial [Gemmatimonadales bacterium]